ncbi:hypothetical protein Ahy_A09g042322 isoform A [Arachis hypogaea]|uniref:Uncharacterized protein n=1 Tax=Arachis hypogaea TaxID=3818 RepID=A0A445BFI1_ARAHY|nr:hypothetical protein Ahy_A09g042322 isoform A [Arachis hypogaea]
MSLDETPVSGSCGEGGTYEEPRKRSTVPSLSHSSFEGIENRESGVKKKQGVAQKSTKYSNIARQGFSASLHRNVMCDVGTGAVAADEDLVKITIFNQPRLCVNCGFVIRMRCYPFESVPTIMVTCRERIFWCQPVLHGNHYELSLWSKVTVDIVMEPLRERRSQEE